MSKVAAVKRRLLHWCVESKSTCVLKKCPQKALNEVEIKVTPERY